MLLRSSCWHPQSVQGPAPVGRIRCLKYRAAPQQDDANPPCQRGCGHCLDCCDRPRRSQVVSSPLHADTAPSSPTPYFQQRRQELDMLCFLASGRGSDVWRRECDMSTRSALLARRGKNELRVGITRYYTNIDEVDAVVVPVGELVVRLQQQETHSCLEPPLPQGCMAQQLLSAADPSLPHPAKRPRLCQVDPPAPHWAGTYSLGLPAPWEQASQQQLIPAWLPPVGTACFSNQQQTLAVQPHSGLTVPLSPFLPEPEPGYYVSNSSGKGSERGSWRTIDACSTSSSELCDLYIASATGVCSQDLLAQEQHLSGSSWLGHLVAVANKNLRLTGGWAQSPCTVLQSEA